MASIRECDLANTTEIYLNCLMGAYKKVNPAWAPAEQTFAQILINLSKDIKAHINNDAQIPWINLRIQNDPEFRELLECIMGNDDLGKTIKASLKE